jgi:DNA-binding TFAR19-related protein (PDSD5 family)
MANKIRRQKQVRLGSRIYKLLKKKNLEKNQQQKNKQATHCLKEILGREANNVLF